MSKIKKVIAQVEQLIRLATNPGASLDEARAAAYAACKLIVKHNLTQLLGHTGFAPPYKKEPDSWSRRGNRVSSFRSESNRIRCMECGNPIYLSELMYYENGYGSTHMRCGKPR